MENGKPTTEELLAGLRQAEEKKDTASVAELKKLLSDAGYKGDTEKLSEKEAIIAQQAQRIAELEAEIESLRKKPDEKPNPDLQDDAELTAEQILALESTEILTPEQKGRYRLILMDYAADKGIVVKGSFGLEKMIEAIKAGV